MINPRRMHQGVTVLTLCVPVCLHSALRCRSVKLQQGTNRLYLHFQLVDFANKALFERSTVICLPP